MVCGVTVGKSDHQSSRVELDSHANMYISGRNSTIIRYTNERADMSPFVEELGTMSDVPIVTSVQAYDDPKSGETKLMVTRNSSYVDSLEHNLAPPFMMREAGLIVNKKAKIHAQDDVSIYFPVRT